MEQFCIQLIFEKEYRIILECKDGAYEPLDTNDILIII